jgi:hypothetical protein
MDISPVVVSQYRAALEMLKQAVVVCPETIWNSPDDKARFWQVAYHSLFYTHLYLQDSPQSFTPWARHRHGYHRFDVDLAGGEPYDRAAILEYLDFCVGQVIARVPGTDLDAPSGFEWLPFSKMELQIYSIRHLQQHVGELMERLGARTGAELDWVGMVRD